MDPHKPYDAMVLETEKGNSPKPQQGTDSRVPEASLLSREDARHFDLDALRAILMALGVIVHSAYVYAVGLPWKVNSPEASSFFTGMVHFLHSFRMPAFFILSGFFALMILKRKGTRRFLEMRLQRLLIPLLSAAILLNSLEAYILYLLRTPPGGGEGSFFASAAFYRHWAEGEWVGHLWFLLDVVVYSAGLAAALAFLYAFPAAKAKAAEAVRGVSGIGGLVFLLPLVNLASLAVASLSPLFYVKWGGVVQLKELLEFLPYFAFGVLLYASPRLMGSLLRVRLWLIPCIAGALFAGSALAPYRTEMWGEAADFYVSAFLAWTICILLLSAFKAILNRPSKPVAYFSEASYSIYLFHHVCVVALGAAFLGLDWNIYVEFSIMAAATLAATLAIHHFLIRRIAPLRFLFNGK